MTRLIALCLGLAMGLAFVSPLRAQEVWKGIAKQNAGTSNYTVIMKLSGATGESDYPELKCGGSLTRVAQTGLYSFYTEKITRNGSRCIDGSITMVSSNGMMAWGWVGVFNGKTFVAWSELTRQ